MKIFIYPKRHTHVEIRAAKVKDGTMLFTLFPGGLFIDSQPLKLKGKKMTVNTFRFNWLFWSFGRITFKKSK